MPPIAAELDLKALRGWVEAERATYRGLGVAPLSEAFRFILDQIYRVERCLTCLQMGKYCGECESRRYDLAKLAAEVL